MSDKYIINLVSFEGVPFTIILSPESANGETFFQVSEQEAAENNESIYQLLEGNAYEYKISNDYNLVELPGIIKTLTN